MATFARPSEPPTRNAVRQRPRPSESPIATKGTPGIGPLPEDFDVERRETLARSVQALVAAGFGFNSTLGNGIVSMQRAWQGPGEEAVMVDSITLDIHGKALAVREGDTTRPVWGPERGPWSVTVTALLSQPAPHGYVRVAPRFPSGSESPREPSHAVEVCPVPIDRGE